MIYDNERRLEIRPDLVLSPGMAFNARWLYSTVCHSWSARDPQDCLVNLEEPQSRYLWSKHNA